jgi:hypothetical protein
VGLRADLNAVEYRRPGFDSRQGLTHPPIQGVPGTLFIGVKLLGREADHSPSSSAEVKNGGAIPQFTLYTFVAWLPYLEQRVDGGSFSW